MTRPPALSRAAFLLLAGGVLATSLAGCSLFDRASPPTAASGPTTPDQQSCARQAEDSPAVKLLINKGLGNTVFEAEHQDELRAVRQDATIACLRTRGIIRQGGVERQKPL